MGWVVRSLVMLLLGGLLASACAPSAGGPAGPAAPGGAAAGGAAAGGGARAIPGLATGQLDLSGGGFSPSYVNAVLRGVGIRIVASISRNEPGGNSGFTMVRKDLADGGQVRDWADLRGRLLAVPGRGSV